MSETSTSHRPEPIGSAVEPSRPARKWLGILGALLVVASITGCQSTMQGVSTDLTGFGVIGQKTEKQAPGEVILTADPYAIDDNSIVGSLVFDSVELSKQKRFAEARHLLADVRAAQAPKSEGFHATTCAMALLALREGDFPMFKRLARQLDNSLGRPVRIDPAFVEVISLYRAVSGKNLPVNAPEKMKRLAEKHFGPGIRRKSGAT
jgi:hypothetical protein